MSDLITLNRSTQMLHNFTISFFSTTVLPFFLWCHSFYNSTIIIHIKMQHPQNCSIPFNSMQRNKKSSFSFSKNIFNFLLFFLLKKTAWKVFVQLSANKLSKGVKTVLLSAVFSPSFLFTSIYLYMHTLELSVSTK